MSKKVYIMGFIMSFYPGLTLEIHGKAANQPNLILLFSNLFCDQIITESIQNHMYYTLDNLKVDQRI